MAYQLADIVPWGRSFAEYVGMFDLSEDDMHKVLLGCADGPSSFNCEFTRRGGTIVSVDPIYEFKVDEIRRRIDETFEKVIEQTRENVDGFVWDRIRSVEELGEVRMKAMGEFLSDYEHGKAEGRYLAQALPSLSFPDAAFDMGLCSHYLFLYGDRLDASFHLDSIRELCRVCREVRIFPLLQLGAVPCSHVAAVVEHFRNHGHGSEIIRVPYEFQRGGNHMLRIRMAESDGSRDRTGSGR